MRAGTSKTTGDVDGDSNRELARGIFDEFDEVDHSMYSMNSMPHANRSAIRRKAKGVTP